MEKSTAQSFGNLKSYVIKLHNNNPDTEIKLTLQSGESEASYNYRTIEALRYSDLEIEFPGWEKITTKITTGNNEKSSITLIRNPSSQEEIDLPDEPQDPIQTEGNVGNRELIELILASNRAMVEEIRRPYELLAQQNQQQIQQPTAPNQSETLYIQALKEQVDELKKQNEALMATIQQTPPTPSKDSEELIEFKYALEAQQKEFDSYKKLQEELEERRKKNMEEEEERKKKLAKLDIELAIKKKHREIEEASQVEDPFKKIELEYQKQIINNIPKWGDQIIDLFVSKYGNNNSTPAGSSMSEELSKIETL
ncbi:MAG: hypothetical protein AAF518_20500 [Spirochaetota bacterium]